MNTDMNERPYWNAIGGHDLTLMVASGRLWKFRAAGSEKVLDARLEPGALVITCSSRDVWDRVDAEVSGTLVRFIGASGSDDLCSDVLLPSRLGLDTEGATTSRRDGVVEVRVPLAGRAVAEPAVGAPVVSEPLVAEPAVAVAVGLHAA